MGRRICKRWVPRVKLLYDIYHMQIMEGDMIRTIRDNIQYIGHFHTGGVPGRHEIDDESQESTGAHRAGHRRPEIRRLLRTRIRAPERLMTSLKQAITLCTV